MNRLAILVGVSAALALGTGEATAQAGIWLPPACKLNMKNALVNSAQVYLKNAMQATKTDKPRNAVPLSARVCLGCARRAEMVGRPFNGKGPRVSSPHRTRESPRFVRGKL